MVPPAPAQVLDSLRGFLKQHGRAQFDLVSVFRCLTSVSLPSLQCHHVGPPPPWRPGPDLLPPPALWPDQVLGTVHHYSHPDEVLGTKYSTADTLVRCLAPSTALLTPWPGGCC